MHYFYYCFMVLLSFTSLYRSGVSKSTSEIDPVIYRCYLSYTAASFHDVIDRMVVPILPSVTVTL
jgi:hypothetical protein